MERAKKYKYVDGKKNPKKYTKEEMMASLVNFYNKNKKFPRTYDFKAENGLPCSESYRKMFGSWYNALIESGISIPSSMKRFYQNGDIDYNISEESLLFELEKATEEHLKTKNNLITNKDFKLHENLYSYKVYIRIFGSLDVAYNKIEKYKNYSNLRMEEDMIVKLNSIYKILGRVPITKDLNYYSTNYSGYYSASTYDHHFGNIGNAIRFAGITPNSGTLTRQLTDEQLLDILRNIYEKTGKYANQILLNEKNEYPSYTTFVKRFGSWETANILAFGRNIKRLCQNYKTKDNKFCRSILEYSFATMLEKNNIKYDIDDIYYRDYIIGLNKKYRFDFLIYFNNEKYFVEIFGLINFKKYNDTINKKIKLCKDNNINLISLYPEDIYKKSQKELYNVFMEKLSEYLNK